jgi:hypothetical protein
MEPSMKIAGQINASSDGFGSHALMIHPRFE